MEIHPIACYSALASRDARFDGAFFVGVASTGIYCRSVCTARLPRIENCTFYPSAAAAERAGLRPCLRCRPELAPGSARIDAASRLAAVAASRIEDGALCDGSVSRLASELGVTERHLRRVVAREYGVSPLELAQTCRLLTAKRLLTDTDLTVAEVALASGYGSIRRFNSHFRESYGLQPTDLRRNRRRATTAELVCEVAYKPPLDWSALLSFLDARAIAGVEVIEGASYARTAAVDGRSGWLVVSQAADGPRLRIRVSASLAQAMRPVVAAVKRLFDLCADPEPIARQLGTAARLGVGIRVPGAFDGFEMVVRAVLGQQISVRAATTVAGRYARTFGDAIDTPIAGLTHVTPTPSRIAALYAEELAVIGVPSARARSIIAVAQAVDDGTLTLRPQAGVEATMETLRSLPGIGEWTAHYIAMRALGWPDAFPHTDLGVRKALGLDDPRQVLAAAEKWRPWRAYAVMHLWKSLEARR